MKTLFLNSATWDLCLDTSGNIAVADEPYRIAQDVASAARLFQGECWYNTTVGVPYFQQILGKQPSIAFLASKLREAALSVPGVVTAQVFISGIVKRQAQGQIQVTDTSGTTQTVSF